MPLDLKLPKTEDISLYRGDTFEFFFRLRDDVEAVVGDPLSTVSTYRDLTGYTSKAQVRNAVQVVLAEFTATVVNQTVARGGVLLTLSPAQTTAMPVPTNESVAIGVWDVQLTSPGGTVTSYIRGSVYIGEDTTR